MLRRLRACEYPLHGPVLQRGLPEAAQFGRRAGQDDGDRATGFDDEARRCPRDSDRPPAFGDCRLLSYSLFELRVGPLEALGDPPRDTLDLLCKLGLDRRRQAGGARQELDGPVVVGRPEPSGDDEQVGRQALAECRLQLLGLVSDERDSRGLEASPRQLLGEKRAVRVAAPAPHELATCDDDRCAGSQSSGGASETRFGVTSSHRRAPVPAPGTTCRSPFSRRRRLAGAKT